MCVRIKISLGVIWLWLFWAIAAMPGSPAHSYSAMGNGLLFTSGSGVERDWWGTPHNMLVWWDAETQDESIFYVDQEAIYVVALSWSPANDLVAVYRLYPPLVEDDGDAVFPQELCLIDRAGILQTCFEDKPSPRGLYPRADGFFAVTWSADGKKIQFLSQQLPEGAVGTRRLIEADIETGQTLRVIYEFPFDLENYQGPSEISWTPTLDMVAVGAGDTWSNRASRDLPIMLVDLDTGAEWSVPAFLSDPDDLVFLCPQFSPMGTYLVAQVSNGLWAEAGGQLPGPLQMLLILDRQGTFYAVAEQADVDDVFIMWSCPVWQADEQAFYVLSTLVGTESMFLHKYSLVDHHLTQIYVSHIGSFAFPSHLNPLVLSPDNSLIALKIAGGPYGSPPEHIAILNQAGDVLWSTVDHPFGEFPVWTS